MGTKAPKEDEILVKVVAKPPNPDEVEVEDDLNVPDMDMGELGDLIEIRSEEDVRNAMVVGELRAYPGLRPGTVPSVNCMPWRTMLLTCCSKFLYLTSK